MKMKSKEQIIHEFHGLIMNQWLVVTKKGRRQLEREYHLKNGIFHNFIDKPYNPKMKYSQFSLMNIYFIVEECYSEKIELYIRHNPEMANMIYREYLEFRQRLRDKAEENIRIDVGVGRVFM